MFIVDKNFFFDVWQKFHGRVKGVRVRAVDTTGAGDAFVAGVLNMMANDLNLYQVYALVEEQI